MGLLYRQRLRIFISILLFVCFAVSAALFCSAPELGGRAGEPEPALFGSVATASFVYLPAQRLVGIEGLRSLFYLPPFLHIGAYRLLQNLSEVLLPHHFARKAYNSLQIVRGVYKGDGKK